jgi:hypothetical protein
MYQDLRRLVAEFSVLSTASHLLELKVKRIGGSVKNF